MASLTTRPQGSRVLGSTKQPAAAQSGVDARPAPAARAAAINDIPLAAVLRGYRISHAVAVDQLLQHAERVGAPMSTVCEAVRGVFAHMDAIVALGSHTYLEERRRINSRPERTRFLRIRAVLAGAEELGMPYPLDGDHVAIVLRGPQPAATLAAVARAAGDAPLLVTEASDGRVWAWLACASCENDIVAALRAHARGTIAAGVCGHESGVAGFRATHRKAQLALRLGSVQGSSVTTYADVALEALAVGGEDLAREFVRAEMGALAEPARRTTLARETLAAYFATGTAAEAARRLSVSERTVTYRLRHAELVLGRPLTVRRAELEMALRLDRLLSGAVRSAA